MARKNSDRPEWFKFWRRNRQQLDIDLLSMESRGVVFTNMMRYFDDSGELLPMSALEEMAFNVVKINMDDSITEYAALVERNGKNGKKGGRPAKTDTNPENPVGFSETQKSRGQKTEDRGQKTEDRSEDADKPRRARFVPPTREEVRAYCRERNSSVDADRFFDYFEAGNWIDAKGQPVKSWKQKLLTWENKGGDRREAGQTRSVPANEKAVFLDELVEWPPGSGMYRPREEAGV